MRIPYVAKVYVVFVVVFPLVMGLCVWFPHTPQPAGPPVVMAVMDHNLDVFAPAWQVEIGRRFPHSVGILCHGGYFIEGQWLTSASSFSHLTLVKDVVKHVQEQYPDRTIVLLACNVDHHPLGIPGVYYAHSSVWCVPDRAITGSSVDRLTIDDREPEADDVVSPPKKSRWEVEPEVVGNIFEFSTDN